jgi:hypothetical protein
LQLYQRSSKLPILLFESKGQPHNCQGEKEKDSTSSGLNGPKFHCHLIVWPDRKFTNSLAVSNQVVLVYRSTTSSKDLERPAALRIGLGFAAGQGALAVPRMRAREGVSEVDFSGSEQKGSVQNHVHGSALGEDRFRPAS